MNRGNAFRALAFGLAIASLVGLSARAADPTADEAGLRAANAAEVSDFLAADSKGLEALWADSFVVTNPLNAFVTKAQVLGMVDSGKLRFTAYERSIDYVHIYGDIAIVAGAETATWSGTLPLAGKTSRLRYTAIWRRSDGAWREIARHANIIPDR